MASSDPFAALDATAQAELVRTKQATPLELVDAAIARIERLNPRLNAVVTPLFERARAEAKGPLPEGPFRGVPFLLKDLLAALQGVPTGGGSVYFQGLNALRDSELVARYKRAGLVIVGKSSTSELGILPTAEPALTGPCRNPWDPERTAGGSSGGSAAAVASGMVPMAHGSDGAGSLRIPASCCGLFALKPTRGRNPHGPDLGDVLHGLVAEHAITRSVRDSAALLDATEGMDLGAPYASPPKARPFAQEVGAPPGRLRIAFTDKAFTGLPLHPDCAAALADAVQLLRELGHSVEERSLALDHQPVLTHAFQVVWAGGTVTAIDGTAMLTGRVPKREQLEPLTWTLYELGKSQSASQHLLSIGALKMFARQIARKLEGVDLWLTPTLAEPPPPLGTFQAHPQEPMKDFERAKAFTPFAYLANISGQPAMTVPLHWTREGLPVGVQLLGRFGDEATLFRLAAQLEGARPWAHRTPPLFA